eukprot:1867679-Amphidinium_carterae.1
MEASTQSTCLLEGATLCTRSAMQRPSSACNAVKLAWTLTRSQCQHNVGCHLQRLRMLTIRG